MSQVSIEKEVENEEKLIPNSLKSDERRKSSLIYRINEIPPIHLTFLFALQVRLLGYLNHNYKNLRQIFLIVH